MKALKIIEKVFFICAIAVVLSVFIISSISTSVSKDGSVVTYSTNVLIVSNYYFALGGGFLALILCVGAFLYFVDAKVARLIGTGCLVAAYACLFGMAINYLSKDTTFVLALVSSILFVCSLLVRFIIWIAIRVKPDIDKEDDPSRNPKVAAILEWKSLLEQDIITKEEFEEKRKAIIESFNKKR